MIDASLALELALVTPAGRVIEKRLRDAGGDLAAPELIDLEILQALRKLLRLKLIPEARAVSALQIFQSAPLQRFSHIPLHARIWALRDNLTAYDAAYFALAEILGAPLFTRDAKFRAAPRHGIALEIL